MWIPDDLWKSDLLESVMAVASDAVDLIAFSYMPYPEGQPLPQPSPLRTGTYRTGGRELLNALQLGLLDEYHRAVPYYFGACWIELVRRDFLEENHLYFDESLKQCEDMIWNLNLLERAHSVGLLDKDLYYYRLRRTPCAIFMTSGCRAIWIRSISGSWNLASGKRRAQTSGRPTISGS